MHPQGAGRVCKPLKRQQLRSGYEAEPNKQHNGWYENEVGRIVKLGREAPPTDWETTLRRRLR